MPQNNPHTEKMAFLNSEPVTRKVSSDLSNSKFICGSSSTQNWGTSQESPNSCILDYDTDTSFFAVYDDSLGREVALYCSENLPEFLKQTVPYETGDLKKGLKDAFLVLDKKIANSEIVTKLESEESEEDDNEEDEVESLESEGSDEENMYDLYEEASMPIEEVMEKYVSKLSSSTAEFEKCSDSKPVRHHHKTNECASASCSSKSSSSHIPVDVVSSSSNTKTEASSSSIDEIGTSESNKACKKSAIPEKRVDSPDSSVSKSDVCVRSDKTKEVSDIDSTNQNGEVESSQGTKSTSCDDVTSSSMPQENGTVSKKGKGKALMKTKGMKPKVNVRPKRSVQQLYNKLLDFEEDSDEAEEEESEDENDKDFMGPNEESSDDDGEDINISIDDDNFDEDSSDEEEEEEKDESDEVTGSSSSYTALVALIRDKKLYIASIGDSRCVVCRNGKAVEISDDHKQESEKVIKTIPHEGDDEGNLSETVGDHSYKQNKELSDQEQTIAEVHSFTLVPDEDEFMFLACDGIWNCMDNQQVIDFIRTEMRGGSKKLSKICEEIIDKCLDKIASENEKSNMTAIIVQFKLNSLKRPAEDLKKSDSSKKLKTEEILDSTESA